MPLAESVNYLKRISKMRSAYKNTNGRKMPSHVKRRKSRFTEAYYTHCPSCGTVSAFNREKRCKDCGYLDKKFKLWRK